MRLCRFEPSKVKPEPRGTPATGGVWSEVLSLAVLLVLLALLVLGGAPW